MPTEIPTAYEPARHEKEIYSRWLESGAFAAVPRPQGRPFVIMMPLPNVTGALHMGHAIDNVMQDLLTRWHRMQGEDALWMPGTDHAGIATQAVVEKRLLELEGKTRHDVGREALVERIWAWKDQYERRIIKQQQTMGCSCDWDRHRFTMDEVCARAVRRAFLRFFRDGLIVQGDRMVNWDCHLQTAISDDEIVRETRQGSFWHLRYPVLNPEVGEPAFVEVATTRPETMLGDTAVACHPHPEAALDRALERAQEKLDRAGARDRETLTAERDAIEARKESHLPGLIRLAAMARDDRMVQLPLMERAIPLILDQWARPELGSGCVKITPAHDPNDYEVWQRHRDRVDIINILETDGSLNARAGAYAGLDRMEARRRVVADLDAAGRLVHVEERSVELGLSDRSKTVVEPYVSRQWFLRMGDLDGGVVCGRGTDREFTTPGLAQAAMDATDPSWSSASGLRLNFFPDGERYRKTYLAWLEEKRDWCISRQLWWGHRIPVWSVVLDQAGTAAALAAAKDLLEHPAAAVRAGPAEAGDTEKIGDAAALAALPAGARIQICLDLEAQDHAAPLEAAGFVQDPDVLDTWFSSGLWPHSTLGWPDPASAPVGENQATLGGVDGGPDCLDHFYPGTCLVTGRDIITLWVVRMVIMGLYNLGDLPFRDVFVHATILDGKGERMSKSKGNGIDPVDIIHRYGTDAMRYVLCDMQTGTQDIRLPVQAISPFTDSLVDLASARHGRTQYTYLCPESGKEFDVLGTLPDVPQARLISERFEVGRNFCNKVWNAARFVLMNLEGIEFQPLRREDLAPEDRWILSRLSRVCRQVQAHLAVYSPAAALSAARDFFWGELCDWYLEMVKPRLAAHSSGGPVRQVLAAALDQTLRLLHPFVPFLTEALWKELGSAAPQRGIESPFATDGMLITAPWPQPLPAWEDEALERRFASLQETIRAIRDLRSKAGVPPARRLDARVAAQGRTATELQEGAGLIRHLAGLGTFTVSDSLDRRPDDAVAVVAGAEVAVAGVIDPAAERTRLEKQRKKLARELEASRKKLDNEKFIQRAAPEAVAKEESKAAALSDQLRALDDNLAALD